MSTARTETVMAMPISLQLAGPPPEAELLDAFFAELRRADSLLSPFLEESEVSRINRGELAPDLAGPLVRQVATLCRLYGVSTGGYFDAWAGGRFDPCGVVKGWALDRAAAILTRAGVRDFLVDGAGDVLARGLSPAGEPWRVGIRHPVQRDRAVRVVLASDLAVATSGTYEKGAHILDPHTGLPREDLLSVTVVGPDLVEADVYATAAFAMGPAGLDFMESVRGYEAYAIDRNLVGRWTSGFDALCLPAEGAPV